MGFRFKEKKDIKTFILYMLMQIDRPVDMATLNDIVMQDDFVNQFEFMDSFFELVTSGAVEKDESDGTAKYSLSTKGRVAVEMLEGDLVGMIKERGTRSAMRLLSFERRGSKAQSEIHEDNGKFILSCSVTDKDGENFSVGVALDSKRRAEAMKRNFDEKPEFIYRAMLGVLSGDINYLADSWIDDEDTDDDN